jgi:hypothetical protein
LDLQQLYALRMKLSFVEVDRVGSRSHFHARHSRESGDDEFGCQQGLLTASFPLEDGEGELVDKLYVNYYIDNISNA